MANEQTNTELSALVPEQWRPRYIAAVYDPADIVPHVLNVTEDYSGKGDIAHITTETTALTVNATASDGSLTVQSQTPNDVQVNVNAEKDITVEIVGKTRKQAYDTWEKHFPISAAAAMRERYQLDLLALYGDVTTTASGDGTGNLGEDEYLAAIQRLVDAKLPILEKPTEFCFALHTSQWGPAKKQGFLDYQRTGEAGGGAASIRLPFLWEVPVVFSTQVASSGGIRQNMLFAKEAFAIAIQRNVDPRFADRLAAAKNSYLMAVLALYGVKTVLGGRANVLKSKA